MYFCIIKYEKGADVFGIEQCLWWEAVDPLKNASLTKITLCVKYIFRNNTKVRTSFKYMIGKYNYYGRATFHQIQYFREWIAKAMLNWVYQRNDSSCMTLNLKLTDSKKTI